MRRSTFPPRFPLVLILFATVSIAPLAAQSWYDSAWTSRQKITINSTFEELGIDSLDGVNILFGVEEAFNINIPDEAAQQIRSVRQMVEGIDKLLAGGGAPSAEPAVG